MMRHTLRTAACASVQLVAVAASTPGCPHACNREPPAASFEQPPPAPPMPDGWVVKSDVAVPPDQFYEVERRLEGKLRALRNTVYEVHGMRVQLNVIVPASTVDADRIFRILANKKAFWASLRQGDLIYEFVGQNASEADIKSAREMLAAEPQR